MRELTANEITKNGHVTAGSLCLLTLQRQIYAHSALPGLCVKITVDIKVVAVSCVSDYETRNVFTQ